MEVEALAIHVTDQNLLIAGWIYVHAERRFYSPAEYLIAGNRKLQARKYLESLL